MKKIIALIVLLLVFNTEASTQEARIFNFKSGLACAAQLGIGWICHETDKILLTGQSECVFDKEKKPCTWYGFEFEYENFTAETEFSCSTELDVELVYGNPKGKDAEASQETSYTFEVPIGSGRFYNPMYTLLAGLSDVNTVNKHHMVCTLDGLKIAEFNFFVSSPSLPSY